MFKARLATFYADRGGEGQLRDRHFRLQMLHRAAFVGLLMSSELVLAQAVAPSREQLAPSAPFVDRPKSTPRVNRQQVEPAPCAFTGNPSRVAIRDIVFVGPNGTELHPDLAAVVQPLRQAGLGEGGLERLCVIRDDVNRAIEKAGYIAAVQFPPQDLSAGVLRLEIVSARIKEFRILDKTGRFAAIINRKLEQISKVTPLNQRQLERLLLEANDIPGLQIGLSLRPANTGPGEVIGEVAVNTEKGALIANLQNYGSRPLGREIGTIRGELYGLTGAGDRTAITYSNSLDWSEINSLQLAHDFSLDGQSTRLGMRVAYATSRPAIPTISLKSDSMVLGIDLSRSIYRAIDSRADLSGGFEWLDQSTDQRSQQGSLPFTQDRLRVLFAQLEGSRRKLGDDGAVKGAVSGRIRVRKGLDIFGATTDQTPGPPPGLSRLEGNAKAAVFRGEFESEIWIPTNLGLSFAMMGQVATDPLLNLEEFQVGNFTFGRGYDPGANGGDNAIALRIEPRFRSGVRNSRTSVEVFGFFDLVRIWNLDTGSVENNRLLRSLGAGIRINSPGRYTFDVLYAKPQDRALSTDVAIASPRLLLSLTVKLAPWRLGR